MGRGNSDYVLARKAATNKAYALVRASHQLFMEIERVPNIA